MEQYEDIRRSEKAKWDAHYSSLPLLPEPDELRSFNAEFATLVSCLLAKGGDVLEAGCGAGFQSQALARLGKYNITVMDFSQEALNYARRLFERDHLKAEYILGDIFSTGKPQFDLVFNAGVLEHYTPDQQVACLRGMASRTRRYVLVLVPNSACYWYWVWRVRVAARGQWVFGKEVPVTDLSSAFKAAGLHLCGHIFLGEAWTESLIKGCQGIDDELYQDILSIHRTSFLPKAYKSYLIAAIGSVQEEKPETCLVWETISRQQSMEEAEWRAAVADALALRVSAEHQLNQLRYELNQLRCDYLEVRRQLAQWEERVSALRESSEWRLLCLTRRFRAQIINGSDGGWLGFLKWLVARIMHRPLTSSHSYDPFN